LTIVLNYVKIDLNLRLDWYVAFGGPIMKVFLILFMATFLSSFAARAATYEWVDDKGVVNFTDNPDKIPAKYRKKVKKRPYGTYEKPTMAPSGKIQEQPQPVTGTESELGGQNRRKLFSGHDETWWRSRFAGVRNELKEIQDGLPRKKEELIALRRKMTIYKTGHDRKAYYEKLAEIEKDEARIKDLNEQLDALDGEASKVGVPFEWRQQM
jgi:hypothetical protein